MTALLDANVLIALISTDHLHHTAAEAWLTNTSEAFATCPITQGSVIRFVIWQGNAAARAKALLAEVTADPRHVFWPDSMGYEEVLMDGVFGHAQVTDAYLAELARVNGGRLATFDRGLAGLHSDVAELVPAG